MRHLLFFWGLLISVVILTSFSNHSRRFFILFSWRFMICSWFQMKLQSWCILLWKLVIDFFAFPFLIRWDTLTTLYQSTSKKNLQIILWLNAFLQRTVRKLHNSRGLKTVIFQWSWIATGRDCQLVLQGWFIFIIKNLKEDVN